MIEEVKLADWELAVRLLVSMMLCGLIGAEREARGQVAGVRTHILVGVGATLFTLVSAYGFEDFIGAIANRPGGGRAINPVDPTRIAAQIITGIGFLGAGAIIRQGFSVRGLTTAAALWMVAAIGMAVGIGYYLGAVAATAIVLVTLTGLRHLRPRIRAFGPDVARLDVRMRAGSTMVPALKTIEDLGAEVSELDASEGNGDFHVAVRLPDELDAPTVVGRLERLEEVEAVVIRRQ